MYFDMNTSKNCVNIQTLLILWISCRVAVTKGTLSSSLHVILFGGLATLKDIKTHSIYISTNVYVNVC